MLADITVIIIKDPTISKNGNSKKTDAPAIEAGAELCGAEDRFCLQRYHGFPSLFFYQFLTEKSIPA